MRLRVPHLSAGAYSLMSRAAEFVLGFLGFMLLVRVLDKETFGVWVLFITVTSIVDMARSGFLQNGLIRFLAGEEEQGERTILLTASLVLNILLTFLFIIGLWQIGPYLEDWVNADRLAGLLLIHCAVLPVLVLLTQYNIVMQARMDFRALFWSGIVRTLPFFGFITYSFLFSPHLSLTELAWAQNACLVLATGAAWWQSRSYLHFARRWSKGWIWRIFHFGKFVFGTNLVSMLSNSLDKFMLGAFLSPVQVAVCNAAGRVMNFIEVPVNSVAVVTYPRAAGQAAKGEEDALVRLYESSVGKMLAMTIPFFLFVLLCAEWIILLVAGPDYGEAVLFLRIISLLALIRPFDRQAGIFLDATGLPGLNFLLVVLTLILTILLQVVLIHGTGLYGAATALVAATGITALIKQAVLRYYYPVRPVYALREAWRAYPAILSRLSGRRRQTG